MRCRLHLPSQRSTSCPSNRSYSTSPPTPPCIKVESGLSNTQAYQIQFLLSAINSCLYTFGVSHTCLPQHDEDKTLVKTLSWQGTNTPVRHDGTWLHPIQWCVINEKLINHARCFALDLNAFDKDRLPSSFICDVFFQCQPFLRRPSQEDTSFGKPPIILHTPPFLGIDCRHALSLNIGSGNCKWLPPQYSVPENINFCKRIIAGFPLANKRTIFMQMEGLMGWSELFYHAVGCTIYWHHVGFFLLTCTPLHTSSYTKPQGMSRTLNTWACLTIRSLRPTTPITRELGAGETSLTR